MDNSTILLMPPLLLMQQISTTVSTRAKTSESVTYCAVASFAAHFSWVVSNAFALWKVGKEFDSGITTSGLVAILWYASWATLGNIIGQRAAIYFENIHNNRPVLTFTFFDDHGFRVGDVHLESCSGTYWVVGAIKSSREVYCTKLFLWQSVAYRLKARIKKNWRYVAGPFESWRAE